MLIIVTCVKMFMRTFVETGPPIKEATDTHRLCYYSKKKDLYVKLFPFLLELFLDVVFMGERVQITLK